MGNKPNTTAVGSYSGPFDADTMHFVRRPNRFAGADVPAHLSRAVFACGCFWGTEKAFWRLPGVYSTAVCYINGRTANPTYRQVCSGSTHHTEATLVYFDRARISLADLLRNFVNCHNPTQGNRQGRDRGSQYRSGVYVYEEDDLTVARAALKAFERVLSRPITSETVLGVEPWLAETYHQQYLAKPGNRQYCSAEPTGKTLAPIDEWDLSVELKAKYAPKLPAAFWKRYDHSIRAPHAPAKWTGGKKAERKALREATLQDDAFQARLSEVRQNSHVLVRYCGGCGFASRAMELAECLRAICGGSWEPTLLADMQSTGRFQVLVRNKDGVMATVHDKTGDAEGGDGDGFVDTLDKLRRICDAIAVGGHVEGWRAAEVNAALTCGECVAGQSQERQGAAAVAAASPLLAAIKASDCAPPAEDDAVVKPAAAAEAVVEKLLASMADGSLPVLLFSKTYCPYCTRTKALLRTLCDFEAAVTVLELDTAADGSLMQAHLVKRTGQSTVPQAFIGGQFMGGYDSLSGLDPENVATLIARAVAKRDAKHSASSEAAPAAPAAAAAAVPAGL
jgi:peptide-methionine (S)-S-oxide reductase